MTAALRAELQPGVRGGGRLMGTVSEHPFVALAVVVVLAALALYLARRTD